MVETAKPAVARRALSTYKLCSFDIYGTLVDWEGGCQPHLEVLQSHLPASHEFKNDIKKLHSAWDTVEDEFKQSQPTLSYNKLLKQSYELFARRDLKLDTATLSDADLEKHAEAFGSSVKDWPAFPDTVQALKAMHELGYKLVPLTNISNASWADTSSRALQNFPFDAVLTAQDIGSYKPDLRNFEYLFKQVKDRFGVNKDEILHVAHGLTADHEPAKKVSLQSVWIERDGSAVDTMQEAEDGLKTGRWAFGWRFPTLQALVDEMKRQRA